MVELGVPLAGNQTQHNHHRRPIAARQALRRSMVIQGDEMDNKEIVSALRRCIDIIEAANNEAALLPKMKAAFAHRDLVHALMSIAGINNGTAEVYLPKISFDCVGFRLSDWATWYKGQMVHGKSLHDLVCNCQDINEQINDGCSQSGAEVAKLQKSLTSEG